MDFDKIHFMIVLIERPYDFRTMVEAAFSDAAPFALENANSTCAKGSHANKLGIVGARYTVPLLWNSKVNCERTDGPFTGVLRLR